MLLSPSCTKFRISLNMWLLISSVKEGHQHKQNKPLIFNMAFFLYLKCSFPPFITYIRCFEQDTSPVGLSTGALVCIISTSVSIESDRSQRSKPTSQVPPGNCWSYLLLERGWLCHCLLSSFPSNPSSMTQCFPEGWCLTPREVMHR